MSHDIDQLLKETRAFPPRPEFSAQAHIGSMAEYEKLYRQSIDDPETFWGNAANALDWFTPWEKVRDWSNPPFARWFVGGKTNITHNCIDRHLKDKTDKTAILWKGEPVGEEKRISFAQLHHEVCRFANALKTQGVNKGDRVVIYLPMIPELAIAVLACARIGAVHSVVFGGFSAQAVAERINDAGAKITITADGGYRRGKIIALKNIMDEALQQCPAVQKSIVVKRTEEAIAWQDNRDCWWHELVETENDDCPAESMDAEDPLFILYTSGSTGKPKGILHTTGGYMVGAHLSSKYIFDLKDDDVYWCTADIGWITGHTYVLYGILSNGVTTLMYEGAPDTPTPDRFWQIINEEKVTVFYTAPTAIRAFMKWGEQWPKKHDLSSLRLLGSVGEPINPAAWMWYHKHIGHEQCPIVDTWWQTETGTIMLSPLPGAVSTKPGAATKPFFGVDADIVDEEGHSVAPNKGGLLVIKQPWPSMLRTVYGDEEKYIKTYWAKFKEQGWYFSDDAAFKDPDGDFWVLGRVDDVLNVSGHRLSTMEIESALVSHESVVEAAVVGFPHEIKGDGIAAFIVTTQATPSEADTQAIRDHVAKQIGALAKPDIIRFTHALPKTRSGKIMRRLLRDIAANREITSDVSTLEDKSVLTALKGEMNT